MPDVDDGVLVLLVESSAAKFRATPENIRLAQLRIDDPYMLRAKVQVIVHALADARHGVFRRQALDEQQGRRSQDSRPVQ
jgi:hypothetical protein